MPAAACCVWWARRGAGGVRAIRIRNRAQVESPRDVRYNARAELIASMVE
jgi:hypothetical protein